MEGRKVKINYKRYKDVPIGSTGTIIGRNVEIAMWDIKLDDYDLPRVFHVFEFDFIYD